VKYCIPVKSIIFEFEQIMESAVVTSELEVSNWLPLMAALKPFAFNHVTKLASGIVTHCAFAAWHKKIINSNV
jgi:hypothetical protein